MIIFAISLIVIVASILIVSELTAGSRARDSVELGDALLALSNARAEDQLSAEDFDRQASELRAALVNGHGAGKHLLNLGGLLAIVLTAIAMFIYLKTQSPEPASPPTVALTATEGTPAPHAAEGQSQANSGGDLSMMVKRLADKMEKNPQNGEGWLLLAKTYAELRQHAEASKAYGKAAALLPPEAGMLADWADAYVVSHGRKWDSEARSIVKRALAANPQHLKALILAGSEAFERADYKGAIEHWKKAKAVAPADSMDAKLVDANIAEANSVLSGKKLSSTLDTVRPETAPASPSTATGSRFVKRW